MAKLEFSNQHEDFKQHGWGLPYPCKLMCIPNSTGGFVKCATKFQPGRYDNAFASGMHSDHGT